ncbi:MAG: hypothetical protein KDA61_07870, partial [Planctomycetales bacterium]|nr:hypothetical protein [Planctomycetales bacterium]
MRRPESLAPSLRRNASWMIVARIAYHGCQFATLALIAALGSPEQVGAFVLGLSASAPVFILSSLQLSVAQCTDRSNRFSMSDYVAVRAIATASAFALTLILGAWWSDDPATRMVIACVALSKSVESFSDILCGRLQKHELMHLVARSMILRGIASAIGVATVFPLTRSVAAAVIAYAIAWLAVVVMHDLPAALRALQTEFSS